MAARGMSSTSAVFSAAPQTDHDKSTSCSSPANEDCGSTSNRRQESGAASTLTPDGSGGSGGSGGGSVRAAPAAVKQAAAEVKAAPGVGRPGKAPQRREHPDLEAALAKWHQSRNHEIINLSFEKVNGDADIPLVCALMTLQSLTELYLGECLKS